MSDKSSVDTFRKRSSFRYLEKVHLNDKGGGGEDIEGGLRKFLGTRKRGFEKIREQGKGGLQKFVYFKTANRRGWGGLLKKLNR